MNCKPLHTCSVGGKPIYTHTQHVYVTLKSLICQPHDSSMRWHPHLCVPASSFHVQAMYVGPLWRTYIHTYITLTSYVTFVSSICHIYNPSLYLSVPASSLHVQSMYVGPLPGRSAEVLSVLLGDVTLQTHPVQRPLIPDRRNHGNIMECCITITWW